MNAHDAYQESRVLTADPLELIRLLYRGALESVGQARSALSAGDIPQRTRAINRAVEILAELTASLQAPQQNPLAANLAQLYDYMQRRILQAHFEQADPPLAEVHGLLETLLEGWEHCRLETQPDLPAAETTAARPPFSGLEIEAGTQYVTLSCSF